MTFFKQLLITRGHNQGTMNDKKSQFSIKNDIMNHTERQTALLNFLPGGHLGKCGLFTVSLIPYGR